MNAMQAASQFDSAYNNAWRSALIDSIRRRPSDLATLESVCGGLGSYRQVARGLQTIAVEQIVGSEGRAHEFDRRFLPRATYLKERWSRVAQAMSEGLRLPPIVVYKLGDRYFVNDGNHRVSVARHHGQQQIEAYVTELLVS